MRRRKLSSLARLALFSLPLLLAPSAALAKLKVVATLPSLAAIADEIGGSHVEVRALASPHQDPHAVDPRPSLVVDLSRADLLLVNGLSLEGPWLDPLVLQSRNARIAKGGAGYLDASTVVERRGVPSGPVDRSMGDVHPGGNPHFLFDPRQGARVAEAIAQKLGSLDEKNAPEYARRGAVLASRLRAYAEEERARFARLPAEKRKVVSYHESLVYLYDWLGLDAVATVEPRPGIPPDPAHVARVLQTMKAARARVVVQEAYYPTSTSSTLARLAGGALVTLEGGARFADGQRYLDHLKHNAEALHAALSR